MSLLICHEMKSQLDFGRFFALPMSSISCDFKGNPTSTSLTFAIAVDPHFLYFGGSGIFSGSAKISITNLKETGQWTEGLWEREVLELFLLDPKSGRYQEFNLSPFGAWWTAVFSAYRVQEDFPRPTQAEAVAYRSVDTWQAAFRIPHTELALSPKDAKICRKANVTGILGAEPARTHLSWCKIPLEKADFHRKEYFTDLTLKPTES